MSADNATTSGWSSRLRANDIPRVRYERHFGNRLLPCFADRPKSVHALLEGAVAQHPHREAVLDEGESLTYGQLDTRVGRAAAGLQRLGVSPGDRVVMQMANQADFIVAFFAVQRLGAIAVPISIREQASGLQYVLRQCQAHSLIIDGLLTERLPLRNREHSADQTPTQDSVPGELHCKVVVVGQNEDSARAGEPIEPHYPNRGDAANGERGRYDSSWSGSTHDWQALCRGEPISSAHPVDEDDTAVLLYTSGTTGLPKGAMLSHLGFAHSVMHFVACMQLGSGVRSALAVPASHVTGLVAIIATTIYAAGSVLIQREFKASKFLRMAAEQRMQATIMVPAMYRLCLMADEFDHLDLSAWQVGGYGGSPMPESSIDELSRRLPGLRLMNAYGATETTSPATVMPAECTRDHLDSVGMVVPCGDIRIMDDNDHEVEAGEIGELWIGGPMVVRGYWDNPKASAAEFVGGYWRSGDLGSIDSAGFVRILDRKKDMINRGGYKIFSVEVENFLLAQDGVAEAAVIGQPCPVLGERVHAIVSIADNHVQAAELQAACARHLADYKVPESITLQREPLPRNANGKVMKRQLRESLP